MSDRKSKKTNEKIRSYFEKTTPDVYDSVIEDCKNAKTVPAVKIRRRKNILKNIIAAAACLAIVLAGAGTYVYTNFFRTASTVSLDVNPGITINLNKKEEVLSVTPVNEDGKTVIGNMTFENCSLETTVNALIGSMLKNGFLSESANSVLVTVDGRNDEKSKELQNRISKEIRSFMDGNDIKPAVLAQKAGNDKDIEKFAEENGISVGKAQIIKQYVKANPGSSAEELAKLNINELNMLIQNSGTVIKDSESFGKASEEKYIGFEKAMEIALEHFGKKASEITNTEKELETEHGIIVYDIEFVSGNTEYDVEINALTGKIEHSEKESAEKDKDVIEKPEFIGKEKAVKRALGYFKKNRNEVRNIEAELENEKGLYVYEVEFESGTAEYKVTIDAVSAEILKAKEEPEAEDDDSDNDDDKDDDNDDIEDDEDDDDDDGGDDSDDDDSDDDDNDDDDSENIIPEGNYIGKAKAKEIAFKHFNIKGSEVSEFTCDLETENKTVVYEIEFQYSGFEYDIEIDASNGKILNSEKSED